MSRRSERRRKAKGRASSGSFVSLPHSVLKHPAFATLTPRGTKLLIDLATQYRGKNNGDLSMPLSQMRSRGWNSSDQLQKAKNELIERGGFGSPTFFYQNHMFFGNDRLALFEELFLKKLF